MTPAALLAPRDHLAGNLSRYEFRGHSTLEPYSTASDAGRQNFLDHLLSNRPVPSRPFPLEAALVRGYQLGYRLWDGDEQSYLQALRFGVAASHLPMVKEVTYDAMARAFDRVKMVGDVARQGLDEETSGSWRAVEWIGFRFYKLDPDGLEPSATRHEAEWVLPSDLMPLLFDMGNSPLAKASRADLQVPAWGRGLLEEESDANRNHLPLPILVGRNWNREEYQTAKEAHGGFYPALTMGHPGASLRISLVLSGHDPDEIDDLFLPGLSTRRRMDGFRSRESRPGDVWIIASYESLTVNQFQFLPA